MAFADGRQSASLVGLMDQILPRAMHGLPCRQNAAHRFNGVVTDALVYADATASARGGLWAHLSSSAR